MLASVITNNIDQIKTICQQHKVKELYVFGSASRNEMNEESDIDFLYTMRKDISLELVYGDNFFDLINSFETILKRKVDMVPYTGLRNRIFIEEVNNTKQLLYKA